MEHWCPPEVPADIPHGDMPGDKVEINEGHIEKADLIFPMLAPMAAEAAGKSGRAVVAVCGGSGVGKSETASLLSHYFRSGGVGAYTLSGDNYPRRIPQYNDAERVRVFRTGGMRGMLAQDVYTAENGRALQKLWADDRDADPNAAQAGPQDAPQDMSWLEVYQTASCKALADYLGTEQEQDYEELNAILAAFKAGAEKLWLKRMGRTEDERWYEEVDFSNVSVLVIEWTHGNSDLLRGVDIPVLLNSTPEETRAHRRARGRDGKTDSPFTTMVLEIGQKELDSCAHKAKIIVSKSAAQARAGIGRSTARTFPPKKQRRGWNGRWWHASWSCCACVIQSRCFARKPPSRHKRRAAAFASPGRRPGRGLCWTPTFQTALSALPSAIPKQKNYF